MIAASDIQLLNGSEKEVTDPVEQQDEVQGEGDKQSKEAEVVEVARQIIL